jgi:DNA mismatch repair protein MutS2
VSYEAEAAGVPQTMVSEETSTTLEFDKILEALTEYASFSAGRERVAALRPISDMLSIEGLLDQVSEARVLLGARPNVTVGGARDVRESAKRAALGSILRADQLLEIAGTLEGARELKATVARAELDIPWIREVAGALNGYPDIVNRINHSVDQSGEVLDSASTRLRSLRQEIKSAHGRLLDKLNSMVASSELRTALQEPIVTVRNGRYVIPVKNDAKSKVPGIVHDQSSSGQTAFIEPLAVTELNNRWAELQIEEKREIERILADLSRSVGGVSDGIVATVEALADLDGAFARAKYAEATGSSRPKLNRDGYVDFMDARHPLLREDVVPISVSLGRDFKVLVITGPNTGGKTVALKTVGLLTLMAQAGMHIPAAEGSSAAVFEKVFADIGDEQSIEQSLSTFSSHLKKIVRILAETDADSLVLLDELGAGTDPQEGSGLARAIIREILDQQAESVVTTHYSELKAFAHEQPGVENASVEFDVRTLSPTYRLVIGIPGRSQALAIAKRLGLPAPIIERARSYLSRGGIRVEKLLSQIQHERRAIANLYKRAGELNEDLTKLRNRLQEEVEQTRTERNAVLEDARAEAGFAVRDLRRRLQELEDEASRNVATRANVGSVRAIREQAEAARSDALTSLGVSEDEVPAESGLQPTSGDIRAGDQVLVKSLGQNGSVIRPAGSEFEVQIGNFKMRRPAEDLQRLSRAERRADITSSVTVRSPEAAPSLEIDVRGQRAQEVEPQLERYVNDGYMSGLETLRVIHGHGTGALRKAIRAQLEGHPLVAGVAPAGKEQGGDGVTVVTLAR